MRSKSEVLIYGSFYKENNVKLGLLTLISNIFKSCDLDDYGKLQSRINELREKLEGEDDGDIVVRR